MKYLFALMLTCLFPLTGFAQSPGKTAAAEEAAKSNSIYYNCINDTYHQRISATADRAAILKDIEAACKPQRDAAYEAAMKKGVSPELAAKHAQDFTNQIFVVSEIEHSEIVEGYIRSITLLRGISEFCDDAVKDKAQAREQERLKMFATIDSRFRDPATVTRVIDFYYDWRIRVNTEETGQKNFCALARRMLPSVEKNASEFFR